MRVCFISTYPPTECGIATYTQYLSDAVKDLEKEVVVVTQDGGEGQNVFPTYSPLDSDISLKLFHVASKLTPDVINIQHEYGLFGSDMGVQIVDFLIRCKLAKIPTVTTLHTVYKELEEHFIVMLENIIGNSSGIIVHENYQKETLKKHFPQWDHKVDVLPHGIREVTPRDDAKKILGLENKKVLLLAGYFRPSKCFHKIVELFPRIADQVDDVVLLVAGKMRGLEFSDYQNFFFNLINNSPAFDKIQVLRGQFPQHTFDIMMSAGDVLAMPYEVGAQSGIIAQSAAFYLPVVTSDIASFAKWNDLVKGGLTAHNDDEYVDHIVKILKDDEYRQQLRDNIRINTQDRKWMEMGKKHIRVFEKYIHVPYGRARYFYIPEGK
jgi:glycosyltransferase involved in cell wall biosynthesis